MKWSWCSVSSVSVVLMSQLVSADTFYVRYHTSDGSITDIGTTPFTIPTGVGLADLTTSSLPDDVSVLKVSGGTVIADPVKTAARDAQKAVQDDLKSEKSKDPKTLTLDQRVTRLEKLLGDN